MHDKGYKGKSQNATVNYACKPLGSGEPKATNMGKDLGPHATNASGVGSMTKAESPNAKAASRNQ
jgi:hypothetical protein